MGFPNVRRRWKWRDRHSRNDENSPGEETFCEGTLHFSYQGLSKNNVGIF